MRTDVHLPITKVASHGDIFARYTIGPLVDYLSRSLPNALRRVLLSSLPGAAITSVCIEGVKHEFQCIEHVEEGQVSA